MSLVPARMKKIQPICKMKALECLKAYNRFFRGSRAANSEVSGGIPPKFEHFVKFCPFILKIWSKKHNKLLNKSCVVTLLQICENTNIDLVNMMCIQNLVSFCQGPRMKSYSICLDLKRLCLGPCIINNCMFVLKLKPAIQSIL